MIIRLTTQIEMDPQRNVVAGEWQMILVQSLIKLTNLRADLTLFWNIIIEVIFYESFVKLIFFEARQHCSKWWSGKGVEKQNYNKSDLFDKYICLHDTAENKMYQKQNTEI